MSAKNVKLILVVTAVTLSTSLLLFKTITSQNEPDVNQSGVVSGPEKVDKLPIAKPDPHQIFESVAPQLQQQTQLSVLLPGFVPEADYVPIYPILTSVTSSKYEIMLGYTEDCNGGTACRLGMISAETITPAVKELTGEKVDLPSGITAYFVDATCGANCSDATISWDHKGSRYTLGIKAGRKEDLVKMANSAIGN
ncbi:MAG: hypothetical protein AB4352_22395 [Hormoscilla sp.]